MSSVFSEFTKEVIYFFFNFFYILLLNTHEAHIHWGKKGKRALKSALLVCQLISPHERAYDKIFEGLPLQQKQVKRLVGIHGN